VEVADVLLQLSAAERHVVDWRTKTGTTGTSVSDTTPTISDTTTSRRRHVLLVLPTILLSLSTKECTQTTLFPLMHRMPHLPRGLNSKSLDVPSQFPQLTTEPHPKFSKGDRAGTLVLLNSRFQAVQTNDDGVQLVTGLRKAKVHPRADPSLLLIRRLLRCVPCQDLHQVDPQLVGNFAYDQRDLSL
jgi:hypothetical protein